jgi:hypothetical protein
MILKAFWSLALIGASRVGANGDGLVGRPNMELQTPDSKNIKLLESTSSAECCHNGFYQGDIAKACSPSNPTYGDGQCYQRYQISCNQAFPGGISPASAFINNMGLGDCLDYCKQWSNGTFIAVDFSPTVGMRASSCLCRSAAKIPMQPQTGSIALMVCGRGPPRPPLPCCPLFKGISPCYDSPNAGDGQCTADGWQIWCKNAWLSAFVIRNVAANNLQSCLQGCHNFSEQIKAVNMRSSGLPGICTCVEMDYNLYSTPRSGDLFTAGSMAKTTRQICAA